MTTKHFCLVVLPSNEEITDWIKPLPPSAGPIETPIYKQGKTPFCWAMTMRTLARTYNRCPGSAYNVLGEIGLSYVGSVGIRWRPSINNYFGQNAQVYPTRYYWEVTRFTGSDIWLDNLKRYIRREIGKHGRPVFLGKSLLTGSKHSYLIVGYDDQGNFIVQDPQDPPDICAGSTAMGYYKASPKDLGINWGIFGDSYVTVAFPKPVDPNRGLVTLNIPHNGVWFTDPTEPCVHRFSWTHEKPEGYRWLRVRNTSSKDDSTESEDPLPPTITALNIGSSSIAGTGLEVINSSTTATKTVNVAVELGEKDGPVRFRDEYPVRIAPNSREFVCVDIPIKKFRDENESDIKSYRLNATLTEGGTDLEQASFSFSIGPGVWFKTAVTQERRRQGPGFGINMIPDRIFWVEPTKPDAKETRFMFNYISKVAGRQPLSAASQRGINNTIMFKAIREGDEYVIRGPALNEIASKAEFVWRYAIIELVTGLVDITSEINLDESGRRKIAENKAKRKKAENMTIAIEDIEFRLRREGENLRLRLRGKVTAMIPDETPVTSQADFDVFGTPIPKPIAGTR